MDQNLARELKRTKKELKKLKEQFKNFQETEPSAKELSGRLAHEIKNPLSLITVALQYLQTKINHNDKILLDTVLAKLQKLDNLASGLSRFAHARTMDLKPSKINVLLETTLHLVSRQCQAKKILLKTNLDRFLPLVDGDLASLSRAILDILKNAVEATPRGGRLMVTTKRQKNEVVVIIKDSGVGISKKNAENVFKPFYTTKREHLGLGLTQAQKTLLEHGGRITFASKTKGKDRGCEFVIHLPISQSNSWWKRL